MSNDTIPEERFPLGAALVARQVATVLNGEYGPLWQVLEDAMAQRVLPCATSIEFTCLYPDQWVVVRVGADKTISCSLSECGAPTDSFSVASVAALAQRLSQMPVFAFDKLQHISLRSLPAPQPQQSQSQQPQPAPPPPPPPQQDDTVGLPDVGLLFRMGWGSDCASWALDGGWGTREAER